MDRNLKIAAGLGFHRIPDVHKELMLMAVGGLVVELPSAPTRGTLPAR
jgi:hypothetical protein